MNGASGFYQAQYPSMPSQQGMEGFDQPGTLDAMDMAGIDMPMVGQAQTLDQIVNQNNQELMRRRRTLNQHHVASPTQDHNRRASMMEFSTGQFDDAMADFQFDPNPAAIPNTSISNQNIDRQDYGSSQKSFAPRKSRPGEELELNTSFSPVGSHFNRPQAMPSYSPSMHSNPETNLSSSLAFANTMNKMMEDYEANAAQMGSMAASQTMQDNMFGTSPVNANFKASYVPTKNDQSGSNAYSNRMGIMSPSGNPMQQKFANPATNLRRKVVPPTGLSMSLTPTSSHVQSPAQMQHTPRRQSLDSASPFPLNDMTIDQLQTMAISNTPQGPVNPSTTRFHSAYSTTGFDMLGVLMRVASRRNPEINIGPVDLSCAFVVCDIDKHDLPIVYCSDMFERLTGYTRYEILGRNCRFLQAPDGKVRSGIKRKYVDDKSVLYLKNQIVQRAEAQLSIINYRKGGQPFMNLLTMIPITWDTDDFRFFVGFQVDLVEQPNSVSGKNPDGTYAINYNRSSLPAYSLPAPPDPQVGLQSDMGQTIPRDEVSQVLSTIGTSETELSKRIWDKVLLENTDDVVHVLSLKGLFLYLSPASRKTLEYEASELVGTALSAICHPSDIVPVTRELKDTAAGAPVNVVYRIRRKHSGYTWFEAHGCLHTEQGKGRKCIILVGRERPVYALDRSVVAAEANSNSSSSSGGESELWSKISTSGMFLYVSSHSRALLDRLPDDLVGTSFQALMRPESRKDFQRVLELARTGEPSTFKHDLQNRRGQVLQAQTTVFPGDAGKGFKPTFLLAQTRLLKMTRAMLLSQKTNASEMSGESASPSTHVSTQATGQGAPLTTPPTSTTSHSTTNNGNALEVGVVTQAGGGGLLLGNQDEALASEDNIFDELKTTRSTSWQFELRQMERQNRLLAEELQGLLSRKKKRKRRKGLGQLEKDCANCHTRVTPEWRRGPSGNRDLCNSCGLRWVKQNGRVSPRKTSGQSDQSGTSSIQMSPSGAQAQQPAHDEKDHRSGDITPTQSGHSGDHNRNMRPPKIEEAVEPPHPNVLPT